MSHDASTNKDLIYNGEIAPATPAEEVSENGGASHTSGEEEARSSTEVTDPCRLFFGTQMCYVFFRLHHALFSRIRIARNLAWNRTQVAIDANIERKKESLRIRAIREMEKLEGRKHVGGATHGEKIDVLTGIFDDVTDSLDAAKDGSDEFPRPVYNQFLGQLSGENRS